jgi:hypothetical protein
MSERRLTDSDIERAVMVAGMSLAHFRHIVAQPVYTINGPIFWTYGDKLSLLTQLADPRTHGAH